MNKQRVTFSLSKEAMQAVREMQEILKLKECLKCSNSAIVERAILTLHKQLLQ
jgi:hypothetical protein